MIFRSTYSRTLRWRILGVLFPLLWLGACAVPAPVQQIQSISNPLQLLDQQAADLLANQAEADACPDSLCKLRTYQKQCNAYGNCQALRQDIAALESGTLGNPRLAQPAPASTLAPSSASTARAPAPGTPIARDTPGSAGSASARVPPTQPAGASTIPAAAAGSSACVNEFTIERLNGSYSAGQITSPKKVEATAKMVRADNGMPVIALESKEQIEGQIRYQLFIIAPSTSFSVGSVAFASGRAIGTLIYSIGTSRSGDNVADALRTNRDWGRSQGSVGQVTVEATAPQIRGTFNFMASGDGYPSLNNYFTAVTNGRFCVNN